MISLGKKAVDQGTDEEKIHADIHPEHKHDNICQTAVYGGKVGKVINIDGKNVTEQNPHDRAKKGAGDFLLCPRVAIRNKHIQ